MNPPAPRNGCDIGDGKRRPAQDSDGTLPGQLAHHTSTWVREAQQNPTPFGHCITHLTPSTGGPMEVMAPPENGNVENATRPTPPDTGVVKIIWSPLGLSRACPAPVAPGIRRVENRNPGPATGDGVV